MSVGIETRGVSGFSEFLSAGRRIAFALLASLILLGPAVGQVFGHQSVFLRQWIMYSGVGIGVLKGNFHVFSPGQEAVELTPLQILASDHYPMIRHYEFDRRVMEVHDLRLFAAEFCDSLRPHDRLSFRGAVGTRHGWRLLDVTDVCALEAPEPEGAPKQPRDRNMG